jgi:hypothetical protein
MMPLLIRFDGRLRRILRLGTPYTEALHVVERYRLIDYEAAVEAQARGFKEWTHIPAYDVDPDYKGKGLQLEFTVEDEGVFTMPWKGIITYRRALRKFWDERIGCPKRAGKVHSQYRGHGLVGQSGPHALREPVLEAGL